MGKTDLLGRWGEAEAAKYLRKKGYTIVAANYRTRFGEIDLIARKGGFLAFVEVKLRKDDSHGAAMEFVDARKQQRLRTTATLYLAQHETELQPRFDVIEVYAPQGLNGKVKSINHLENAF